MTLCYILDAERQPVAVDLLTWGKWYEEAGNRQVACSMLGKAVVSTVFIGIDQRLLGEGPPILFETMVFRAGDPLDQHLARCCTWAEAEAQHARIEAEVGKGSGA